MTNGKIKFRSLNEFCICLPPRNVFVTASAIVSIDVRVLWLLIAIFQTQTMNQTNQTARCSKTLSPDMTFGYLNVLNLVCYTVAFVVSLVGNLTMLFILTRNMRQRISRVYTLLVHMNCADLLVTVISIPKDIVHNCTIVWIGPDWLCKAGKFFDVFGVYLSANVLICMSLDRFFSIIFPLYTLNARKRVRLMLVCAWLISAISSLPQLALFQVAQHPCFKWYHQCISVSILNRSYIYYDLYNSILNALEVYLVPFVVVCFCYTAIMYKISIKNTQRATNETELEVNALDDSNCSAVNSKSGRPRVTLRRSDGDHLKRARSKTLRMTVVMVLAFIVCWTPYFIAAILHFADIDFATGTRLQKIKIHKAVEQILYLFAVFNSCINPYLYGYFSFDLRYEILHLVAAVNPGLRARLRQQHQQRRSQMTVSNQHRTVHRNWSDTRQVAHRANAATVRASDPDVNAAANSPLLHRVDDCMVDSDNQHITTQFA